MKLAILGATGGTGRELVRQALDRGHHVLALVRDPARAGFATHPRLQCIRVDATDPQSLANAVDTDTTLLSGLGVSKGARPGVLSAGAQAAVASRPARIIWLGAFGTGASAKAGGWLARKLLNLIMGAELPDKVAADTAVLRAGGTVFHAGPLSTAAAAPSRRTVGLDDAPARLFPAGVSRATVAAAMIDEAEVPRFAGQTAIPLQC
jgi:NAD(P)-dependent dehydrogenase (short-subunit alcohol dehydrogenase family)